MFRCIYEVFEEQKIKRIHKNRNAEECSRAVEAFGAAQALVKAIEDAMNDKSGTAIKDANLRLEVAAAAPYTKCIQSFGRALKQPLSLEIPGLKDLKPRDDKILRAVFGVFEGNKVQTTNLPEEEQRVQGLEAAKDMLKRLVEAKDEMETRAANTVKSALPRRIQQACQSSSSKSG